MVAMLRQIGVRASRVPLSGSAGGEFSGDLQAHIGASPLRCEVKGRANGEGFKTVENWLGDNDLLFLIRDRATPLVTMPWPVFAAMIKELVQDGHPETTTE